MRNINFTHCILTAALLFGGTAAKSQTVPGSAFPVAGDVFTLTLADTAGVLPGAGGAGTTWNFAALVASGATQVDSFLAPSATPYGGVFPTATVAVHEILPGTNYFVYYYNNTANSVYQRLGNVKPDTVIYNPVANQFPYPLTSGTTFSGSYYAHYRTANGSATEAGTGGGGVDGTGTLTLPTGTYSNVIRAHSTRSENDTTYGTSTNALLQTDDYYEWYQPNSYYPILSIHYEVYSVFGITAFKKKTVAYRAGSNGTSGISDITASSKDGLMVYPNPSCDHTTVVYEMSEAGESQIAIYDLTGRLMQSTAHASGAGVQTVSLATSSLPVGMYEVKVTNAGSAASVKLQITK